MRFAIVLICCLFLISFCNGQQYYPCNDSRVGKIIIKPLLINGNVHYELANKKVKKAKRNNGVFFSRSDSAQQNSFFRIYHFTKDSEVMVEYNYDEINNACYYIFSLGGEKRPPFRFIINSVGQVEKKDTNQDNDNPFEEYTQHKVDVLLKFLEQN